MKENNYFIDDLIGEITYAQWNVAQKMVDYAIKYNFKEELKLYLKTLKCSDKSSMQRYEILLKNL